MPWMEILVVIGIIAETAVLKVLLAVGGAQLVLFAAITGFGAAFLNRLIDRDLHGVQSRDEPSGAFMVTLALAPPAILALVLFARWAWSH